MREIVTLQLGHLSNFVATHFWNAQESYFTYSKDEESLVDHDVHWRPGVGSDGSDTFLPRTVIYDLKGGFGSLRKINALYEPTDEGSDAAASSLWPGRSVVHKQDPIEQSAYQQALDTGSQPAQLTTSAVRYWSDFSRTFYHPRSLSQLYDFELNSSIRPFDRFSMGSELFNSLERDEDMVDRDFRPFVEECDRMQGVQLFATLDDAWGGFAGRYLASLRDEYPKTCLWLWGLTSPMNQVPREKRQARISNTAQSIAEACSLASMVVPLSLPERLPARTARIDVTSPWHVSGVLSTAVETALLQTRLSSAARRGTQPLSMWDVTDGLNTSGTRTLARLRMSVGESAKAAEVNVEEDGEDQDKVDFFGIGQMKGSLARPGRNRVFGQHSSYRGPSRSKDDEEPGEEADTRIRRLPGDPVIQSYESSLKFPLPDSFPSIYQNSQDEAGLSVMTTLSTETSQVRHLEAMKTHATWSIALDERETLSNSLAEIADAYRDDWESGSDEDDDDM